MVIGKGIVDVGDNAFDTKVGVFKVFYQGDSIDWTAISIGENNTFLNSATRYYYVEKEVDLPDDSGNYWYYDENGEIAIW